MCQHATTLDSYLTSLHSLVTFHLSDYYNVYQNVLMSNVTQ